MIHGQSPDSQSSGQSVNHCFTWMLLRSNYINPIAAPIAQTNKFAEGFVILKNVGIPKYVIWTDYVPCVSKVFVFDLLHRDDHHRFRCKVLQPNARNGSWQFSWAWVHWSRTDRAKHRPEYQLVADWYTWDDMLVGNLRKGLVRLYLHRIRIVRDVGLDLLPFIPWNLLRNIHFHPAPEETSDRQLSFFKFYNQIKAINIISSTDQGLTDQNW